MTTPAVLSRREAAAYVRLSPRTFARQVADGRLPAPLDLTCRRKLWSRAALDRAILASLHREAIAEGPEGRRVDPISIQGAET